jgi:hypothetical protein
VKHHLQGVATVKTARTMNRPEQANVVIAETRNHLPKTDF